MPFDTGLRENENQGEMWGTKLGYFMERKEGFRVRRADCGRLVP